MDSNSDSDKDFLEAVFDIIKCDPRGGEDYVEGVARIMCKMLQPNADPDAMGPLPRGFEDGKDYPLWTRVYGAVASTVVGYIFFDKVEGLKDDLYEALRALKKYGGEKGHNFVRWNYPDLYEEME